MNKLYLLKNIENYNAPDAKYSSFEYEVSTDANVKGEISFGPYYFTIWEVNKKKETQKLCLQIKVAEPKEKFEPKKSGYYHNDGIPGEILSLSSLFLRIRLILGPSTRINDNPKILYSNNYPIDGELINKDINLASLESIFNKLNSLNLKKQEIFMLATRLYYHAIIIIEKTPDIAYLYLISAIECLSNDFQIEQPNLEDIDADLNSLILEIENEDLRLKIKNKIISRERQISKKFIEFTISHIDSQFWNNKKSASYASIDEENIRLYLKNIYDQRSKTLHQGEVFPEYIFTSHPSENDVPYFESMQVGNKIWLKKDLIPYPSFYEKLVNHVLLQYFYRNTNKYE